MSDNALKIGVAGLGTVGCGAIKILQDHAELLEKRCGRPLQIVGVNARNKAVKRAVDVSAYPWFDHAQDMIPEVDVLLEMVGESEGFAYNLVKQALDSGVHVVTANKALLAHYGVELAELAESKGVSLMYEAAVAGGIPAIKVARESFAGNGDIDSCITLRTGLVKDGRLYVQAGGGVVADSDPDFEHQECINKAKAVFAAAEQALSANTSTNS